MLDWKAVTFTVHSAPRYQGHSLSVKCYDFCLLTILFMFNSYRHGLVLIVKIVKIYTRKSDNLSDFFLILVCSTGQRRTELIQLNITKYNIECEENVWKTENLWHILYHVNVYYKPL